MTEILPAIEKVSQMFPLAKEDREDLRQDLVLKCYENEGKVLEAHQRNEITFWLYRVAKNHLHNNRKANNVRRSKELTDIPDTPEQYRYLFAKEMKDMIALLNQKERLWINLWLECGMSTKKLEQITKEKGIKITRQHASVRIKAILEKWKHLEIFLPSLD